MPSRDFILKLALLSIGTVLPLWFVLIWKWPIDIDLIFYGTILKSFSTQLWAGDLYPRWLEHANGGYGSPVFLFYSPLPYYVMSLFQWMSPFDPHGFLRVFIGMSLALFLAGITCYRWLKILIPEQAEKGALLYAGFPYLFILIYFFFGMAQLWAIACFPLLLEAAHQVLKKGWRGIPALGFAYGALCLVHLPSALAFGAIPGLYVLALSPKGRRIANGFFAGISAVLGAGLAAIYLLPAMENKPYIAVRGFLEGKFFYANSFLDVNSLFGMATILLPLLGFYLELPKNRRREFLTLPIRFWLVILAVLLFMVLPLSKPIWDHVAALHYLQGPFRFFNSMLPGAILIAASWLPHAKSRMLYKAAFILGFLVSVAYSSQAFFFENDKHTAPIINFDLINVPEYTTRWADEKGLDFRFALPKVYQEQKPVMLASGQGNASLVSQSPRAITLHADVKSAGAVFTLRRFYFRGWQAPDDIAVGSDGAMLSVKIPRGNHDITLTLPWFDGEREGALISLGALFTLLAFLVLSRLPIGRNAHIIQPL